jgi:hypothetical protein
MPDDGHPKQGFDQEPSVPKRGGIVRVVGALVFAAVCFLLVWLAFE